LVVYDGDEKSIWASDTWNKGKEPFVLVLQDDGNLVLYDSTSTSTWASGKTVPHYNTGKPLSNAVTSEPVTLSNLLSSDGILLQDHAIKATHFEYYARVESDGNFILYNNKNFSLGNSIWSSNSHGKGHAPFHLKMQDDGNLVLYDV
jgi:predicted heme/steroid binding protein